MILPRRSFLTGIGALIVAPAVVKVSSLMPVRSVEDPFLIFINPPLMYTPDAGIYIIGSPGMVSWAMLDDPSDFSFLPRYVEMERSLS